MNVLKSVSIAVCFGCATVVAFSAQQPAAPSEPGPLAVGAKIGTMGIGAEATLRLTDELNLRGSANVLSSFSYNKTVDDIDYDADLDLESFFALLDWHLFGGGFRVSGGVVFNNSDFTLTATPSKSEKIGDVTYTPAQIGTIRGDVDVDSTSPYVGIGYGNAVGEGGHFSFSFDLGVIFTGYDLTLSSTGLLASDPTFQANLKKEQQDVQDDLDSVSVYPVLMVGMAYRF